MELLDSTTPSHKAELHHRLSGPTALLVVALLAPLLARAQPREGRFGRVVAAVLIYAIYINLLEIGKSWLTHERAWPVLGLWWVHGLFASVGLGLWIYQYGISFQSFRRLTGARQTP
jgi:lipopolysaccharide export system permease protein